MIDPQDDNASTFITNATIQHGDHNHPMIEPWFMTTIFICFMVTFIVGFVANAVLCYIIYKRKARKRTIHLLTFNLAVSDLIVLVIYLPMQIYQINSLMAWELGRALCKVFYGINAATINANILTLVAITRDRYIAVTNPLKSHSTSSSTVKKWLVAIWAMSIVVSVPLLVVVDAHDGYCYETWSDPILERSYWILLFLLQLVIPFIYFIFAYTMIVHRIKNKKQAALSASYDITAQLNQSQDKRTEKRRMQQIKLLRLAIILVVSYAVCVSPQHAVFFGYTYGTLAFNPYAVYIFIMSNFLLIINSLINPCVYASQSHEMKNLLHTLFCCGNVVRFFGVEKKANMAKQLSITSGGSITSSM